MARRITLELSEEVLNRAERLATLSHRAVTDVLADAVAAVLPPLEVVLGDHRPVSELADDEVLRWTAARLPPEQDRRLSQLLDQQQAGTLADTERRELLTLMQLYEANLLRQADALVEAVRRGLREPLSP